MVTSTYTRTPLERVLADLTVLERAIWHGAVALSFLRQGCTDNARDALLEGGWVDDVARLDAGDGAEVQTVLQNVIEVGMGGPILDRVLERIETEGRE